MRQERCFTCLGHYEKTYTYYIGTNLTVGLCLKCAKIEKYLTPKYPAEMQHILANLVLQERNSKV